MAKLIEDRYLGDGVYASYDGWNLILDLRAQDNTTRIALEPPVLKALDLFRQNIQSAKIEKSQKGEDNG